MKKIILLTFLSFAFALNIFAQSNLPEDRRFYYNFGDPFFAEAHVVPSESPDSVKILVFYRIMYDALPFKQIDDEKKYKNETTVEISFADSDGIIISRSKHSSNTIVDEFEETNSKTKFIRGYIEKTLPNDNYKPELSVLGETGNKLMKTKIKLNTKVDKDGNFYSAPIFAEVSMTGNFFTPFILEDKISFTSPRPAIIVTARKKAGLDPLFFEVSKMRSVSQLLQWNENVDLSGSAEIFRGMELNVEDYSNNEFSVKGSDAGNLKNGYYLVKLPAEEMVPGEYLFVFRDGKNEVMRDTFLVEWADMPLSLRSIDYSSSADYAVSLMYYILTEEEFDAMDSGSDDEMVAKLLAYWTDHDPSKNTPYNEAMAEYFSRADFAFYNYRTMAVNDGARTDMGKVYMLYGKPDKKDVKLTGEKSFEVWEYKRLDKEFIFETVSAGVFKLIKINDIKNRE